ncbi:MAG: hypothetical protein GWN01_15990 [Nitrosopumilaceae archaeon]|nr:HAMP domain-containing histidine kinase [Nitrosopumilaceae archaeon]NIU02338.1 HAMP domain-containing histidine kinase [Nitrosopumilaceae archaeon]NIU88793.1 hypothetical protein [Nitrosopumilaceae archaeon]NIV66920.1 hypothetical protein [Nitrosopumilaceae archaeon]NIX62939.1 hypothetical protein [Nitrosopumilaceae archaeon]
MKNEKKHTIKANHEFKETKQVNMLMKRILQLSEQAKRSDEKFIKRKTRELEQTFSIASKIIYRLEQNKSKYSKKYLEKLNHEISTPLVPIKAYCQTIQQNKYGTLNDEQKKRLDVILASINELEQNINRLIGSGDKKH